MRQVTSPGGDDVTLLPDFTERGQLNFGWANTRRPVLAALWKHGEIVDNKSGRATLALHALAQPLGYNADVTALAPMLKNVVMERCITRVQRGKRTYSIKLTALPETWYERLRDEFPIPPQADLDLTDEPAPVVESLNGHSAVAVADAVVDQLMSTDDDFMIGYDEPWQPAPIELNIAGVVAMQMLTRVVEIISTGVAPSHGEAQHLARVETDLREVEHRLSLRLEENTSLRRKYALLGEELRAVKLERDGLRQRLRIAEHNLQVAGSADVQRQVTEQVRQELAKIMTAKPGPRRELASDRES